MLSDVDIAIFHSNLILHLDFSIDVFLMMSIDYGGKDKEATPNVGLCLLLCACVYVPAWVYACMYAYDSSIWLIARKPMNRFLPNIVHQLACMADSANCN